MSLLDLSRCAGQVAGQLLLRKSLGPTIRASHQTIRAPSAVFRTM